MKFKGSFLKLWNVIEMIYQKCLFKILLRGISNFIVVCGMQLANFTKSVCIYCCNASISTISAQFACSTETNLANRIEQTAYFLL